MWKNNKNNEALCDYMIKEEVSRQKVISDYLWRPALAYSMYDDLLPVKPWKHDDRLPVTACSQSWGRTVAPCPQSSAWLRPALGTASERSCSSRALCLTNFDWKRKGSWSVTHRVGRALSFSLVVGIGPIFQCFGGFWNIICEDSCSSSSVQDYQHFSISFSLNTANW